MKKRRSVLAGVFALYKISQVSSRIFLNTSFHKACPAKQHPFPAKSLRCPGTKTKAIAVLNNFSVFQPHESFDMIDDAVSCF